MVDDNMLKTLLVDHAVLNQFFASVELVYGGSPFVSIPSQIIQTSDREQLFKLSHKLGPDDELIDGNLNRDVSLIYSAPKSISKILMAKYPNLQKIHELTSLFKWIQPVPASGSSIYARLKDELLLLLVIKNGKLNLVNYYDAKTSDDVFYFVMSTMEQLELDPETTDLQWLIRGEAIDESTVKQFQNYISTVNQDSIVSLSKEFDGLGLGFSSILGCEL
jgi:Protein of unknown function (DUF3822)